MRYKLLSPIEMMMDGLTWVPVKHDELANDSDDGLPIATHEGILNIAGIELKCFRLSNGQAVIDAESMERFLQFMGIRE